MNWTKGSFPFPPFPTNQPQKTRLNDNGTKPTMNEDVPPQKSNIDTKNDTLFKTYLKLLGIPC